MSETLPCLLRVGENVKKHKVIKLDHDKVTVGRSGEVNYVIMSNMISRCHAILKRQEDETWTITDNKSLNGVFVNGKQLQPFTPHSLRDGDMVQFGVPTAADVPAEFVYKFHSSLKIRIEKKTKRFKGESQNSTLPSDSSQVSENGSECDEEREKKRKGFKMDHNENKSASDDQASSREAEYKAKLAEMERLLKEKEEKQSEVEKQLEKERQERERTAQEVAELKEKEQVILMEMQDKQAQLEKEKDELKRKIQAELETTLKEKELALRTQLASEKESLMQEKNCVEENLQKEMAKALEEKDKEVENQLMKMKDDLDKIIQEKDQEQKLLESRLSETREESEMAKLQALKAKDDVMTDFADLMEMELQCSICNELFIKAVSLNCSHVFCKLCINQWKKVKKECPNCRKAITSEMQAIALDSYIEKMVERLSDDLKARRKALVEHRKAEQDKFDGVVPGTSGVARILARPIPIANVVNNVNAPAATRVSNRIRGRQRGRGRGRGGNAGGTSGRGSTSTGASTVVSTTVTTVTTPACTPNTAVTTTSSTTSTAVSTGTSTSTVTSTVVTPTATTSATPVTSTATSSTTPVSSIEISSDEEEDMEDEEEDYYNRRYGRRRYMFSSDSNSEDQENSSDGMDSDSDTSPQVEGISGRYFGGYGRCFKCGNRGHWANGCPF